MNRNAGNDYSLPAIGYRIRGVDTGIGNVWNVARGAGGRNAVSGRQRGECSGKCLAGRAMGAARVELTAYRAEEDALVPGISRE